MRTNEDAEYRVKYLDNINNQIFDLVYYGKFSYQDCESMTSVELKWFHKKLLETKTAENKAKEEALKSANKARESARSSVRHHSPKRK